MTMTFVTTPEPQMFNGYLDGLKDELEMYYMNLFYNIITLLGDMSTSWKSGWRRGFLS